MIDNIGRKKEYEYFEIWFSKITRNRNVIDTLYIIGEKVHDMIEDEAKGSDNLKILGEFMTKVNTNDYKLDYLVSILSNTLLCDDIILQRRSLLNRLKYKVKEMHNEAAWNEIYKWLYR